MSDKPNNSQQIIKPDEQGVALHRSKKLLALTDKILHKKLVINAGTDLAVGDGWFERLIAWADENDISEEQLPRDKEKLLALTELDLSYNDLSELPAEIGQLSKLQEFDLSFNYYLRKLPAEIGRLRELRKLNLGINFLSELPAEIAQLRKLQELDLSENTLALVKLSSEIEGFLASIPTVYR